MAMKSPPEMNPLSGRVPGRSPESPEMGFAAASLEGFPYRGSRYWGFATEALSRRKGRNPSKEIFSELDEINAQGPIFARSFQKTEGVHHFVYLLEYYFATMTGSKSRHRRARAAAAKLRESQQWRPCAAVEVPSAQESSRASQPATATFRRSSVLAHLSMSFTTYHPLLFLPSLNRIFRSGGLSFPAALLPAETSSTEPSSQSSEKPRYEIGPILEMVMGDFCVETADRSALADECMRLYSELATEKIRIRILDDIAMKSFTASNEIQRRSLGQAETMDKLAGLILNLTVRTDKLEAELSQEKALNSELKRQAGSRPSVFSGTALVVYEPVCLLTFVGDLFVEIAYRFSDHLSPQQMDRTWILFHSLNTPTYLSGIEDFMKHVSDFTDGDKTKEVICPCRVCLNIGSKPQHVVSDHLFVYGMDQTYIRWINHGEHYDQPDIIDPLYSDGYQPEDLVQDEATANLLRDLYPYASQQPHGYHKKPLFHDLIEDAKRLVAPGSVVSRFELIVKLLHDKSYQGITNKAFNAVAKTYSDALPGAGLPKSFYEVKQYIKVLGLGYEKIDFCKNNCALFWMEYNDLDECPVCKESRWKHDGAGGKKKIPWKVLRYFPLVQRLQRLFASEQTSRETRWHKEILTPDPDLLRHPADGDEWKQFDLDHPDFAADPRNLRLGLATDGFNPFGNMSNSYSMWPVLVTPYNQAPWTCTDQSNCMMALLIPGPKSPGKDFDVFMQPLIRDLQTLWEGVPTRDVCQPKEQNFLLRAAVLYCTHDYPALGTMSGRVTSGYNACVHCDTDQLAVRIINKICYMGHRRFLPLDHSFRKNRKKLQFIGDQACKKTKPQHFKSHELEAHLEAVRNVKPGKPPAATAGTAEKNTEDAAAVVADRKRKKRGDELSLAATKRKMGGEIAACTKRKEMENDRPRIFYKRRTTLWDLPYWAGKKLRHNIDIMHMEKNICDSIVGTLLNIPSKTKDSSNARIDCATLNVNRHLQLDRNDKVNKGKEKHYKFRGAEFTLPMPKRRLFCEYLRGVMFPFGFASNIANCLNAEGNKLQGLKTHDCHILLQRLLAIGIKDLVKPNMYNVIAELGRFFREICSKTLSRAVVERLKVDIAVILCKLELIYPPAFFDVMVHLAVHLPDEALLRGPVQYGWMYPIERRLCTFKNTVRNKARPEACIAVAYIAAEAYTFASRYIPDIETRFNRGRRILEVGGSVFNHGVELIGKRTEKTLEQSEFEQLSWLYMETNGKLSARGSGFQDWFEKYISKLHAENPGAVSADLLVLSRGPDKRVLVAAACNANGVHYSSYEREQHLKTRNSGITTSGDHLTTRKKRSESFDHYGHIEEVIQLFYSDKVTVRSVVLFKCYWYNQDPNKGKGARNDGYFISVNTTAQWYKDDPYILVPQAAKVLFLEDRSRKGWQYVQKFVARNIYDLDENADPIIGAQQDDFAGCMQTKVADIDETSLDTGIPAHDGEVDFTVEVSIVDKEMDKLKLPGESQEENGHDEQDETMHEYQNEDGGDDDDDDDDDDDSCLCIML
ncbi:hypothetical protein QYE76_041399 [Lolium multiflorum]|uniref:Transposon protein, putative, CACTA, En/Spm sub-class n=1 Tax=Lolium multiflorum TaxID=4521 RepID=A0AAD8WW10_LOLMU|nr:hypothetical protein QYE76_041399 [Lolium multiflorum]